MRWGSVIWGVLLLSSANAFSLPAILSRLDCRRPLKRVALRAFHALSAPTIKPIPETLEKRIYPNALPLAGKLLRPNEIFPELKDEHYIYLVFRYGGQEYTIYDVRAPGESPEAPGKNLATHSAMLKRASELLNVPASAFSVVAAGQFQILHGEVARIDNRSGSWRGSKANLDYGVRALERAGLEVSNGEIGPRTKRDDYNTEGPDVNFHAEADEIADQRRRVDADPALSRIRHKIMEIHETLYREYPELRDPETPGYLDPDKVFAGSYLDPHRRIEPIKRGNLSMVKAAFSLLQIDGPHTAAIYFNDFESMSEAKVMELFNFGLNLHRERHLNP